MSLRILLSACRGGCCPLAYGGPSCRTNFGAPGARARGSGRRGRSASHHAIVSGSAVCRLAFIGNSVRGRLRVSFQSGIGKRIGTSRRSAYGTRGAAQAEGPRKSGSSSAPGLAAAVRRGIVADRDLELARIVVLVIVVDRQIEQHPSPAPGWTSDRRCRTAARCRRGRSARRR